MSSKPSKQRCVLITQNQLSQYLGSEIVTLELAEYLSAQGYKVIIGTNNYEQPISLEIDKIPNVSVFNIGDPKLQTTVERYELELVWVQHQLLPQFFLEHLDEYKDTKVIYHHMSSQHPLEFPFLLHLEQAIADLILFNSPETKDAIEHKLGTLLPNTDLFYNAAPDVFTRRPAKDKDSQTPKRVLVVSNHIPTELREAIELLRQHGGVEVVIYGYDDKVGRITPDVIQDFDTVVTIGKTVQYSILMNVPVYCYDHFGGPGYLNNKNFEKAMYHNFAGRGFSRKTNQQIANEIIAFSATPDHYSFITEDILDKITLSKRMEAALHQAQANHIASSTRRKLEKSDIIASIETLAVISILYAQYIRVRNAQNDTIQTLKHEKEAIEQRCTEAKNELDFIHSKRLPRWIIDKYKRRQG